MQYALLLLAVWKARIDEEAAVMAGSSLRMLLKLLKQGSTGLLIADE